MANTKLLVLLFAILVPSTILAASVPEDLEEHSRQKRSITNCDYNQQAGFTCTGCNQVLACFEHNIGINITCSGQMPYCNNGHCSMTKGSLCNST